MSVQERIPINAQTRYAGFWRRLAASLIDTLLLVPLLAVILYLIYGPAYFHWAVASDELFAFYGSADLLVSEILPILVAVFFWIKFLGTPGKLLLGCHVVHAQTGEPLTVGRALLRYLGYYVSVLTLMLGFLWVIWDKRKQGFHDKMANSVVVLFDEASEPVEAVRLTQRDLK